MKLTVGSRYASQVCDTEVIVVRAPSAEVALECGGYPMTSQGTDTQPGLVGKSDLLAGSLLGKRYTDGGSVELVVVRGGRGTLAVNGVPLKVQVPRILPASD